MLPTALPQRLTGEVQPVRGGWVRQPSFANCINCTATASSRHMGRAVSSQVQACRTLQHLQPRRQHHHDPWKQLRPGRTETQAAARVHVRCLTGGVSPRRRGHHNIAASRCLNSRCEGVGS